MKFKPGQRVRCVDNSGATMHLKVGSIYTVSHYSTDHNGSWCHLKEMEGGWYEHRFEPEIANDGFESFMERVMKPVKLDEPVTA